MTSVASHELVGRAERLLGPNLVEWLQRLVEAESPSSDQAAVARCAEVVAELGGSLLGVSPRRCDGDGVPNLKWESRGPAKIALIGHLDTIWPVGTIDERPFRTDGEWAYGPGVLDMKCGIVQALAALSLVGTDAVTLLLNGDEEVGSRATRSLIEELAQSVEAVLVLEPALGPALKTSRKGVATYELEILGREAHAGIEPENGINATLAMAHAAIAAAALADPELATTVTPTVAASGFAVNAIPARASLHLDVRAWSADELARVDRALENLEPALPGARFRLSRGPDRPPLEERHARDLFELASRQAAALGLETLEGVGTGGGSDGNFAAGVGTPTLDGLGPVGTGAHTTEERVLLREAAPRTALLAALIEALRSGG